MENYQKFANAKANFIKRLKLYRELLSRQEIKTLRGQALNNDVTAAKKGLEKIINKRLKPKETHA